MTRREVLALSALAVPAANGQSGGHGMSSRNVRPVPRDKPSGIPYHARFTNVASEAGLKAPVIYGDVGRADYIQESIGCGVAFLDYDNDGWQDIVVLTGRRRSGPTPADATRSEEHTSELQSLAYLVCRLLLEKKKKKERCGCVVERGGVEVV